jgi:hypothetical protein
MNFMLDSGAHSLYVKEVIKEKRGYNYFESDDFWDYVDDYAKFVKKYIDVIDTYVNVDVIMNPEMSWEVYQYLKKDYGLNPMPVVHFGADMKWLKKYMGETDYIGIGGIGQTITITDFFAFADQVFETVCDDDGIPQRKLHGFAVTSFRAMMRYPWYSVDSTSWVMTSRMGSVYIPRRKKGGWVYDENCWKVVVSTRSPSREIKGQHIDNMSPGVKQVMLDYIHDKGFRLGKSEFKEVKNIKDYKLKEGERWWGKAEADAQRSLDMAPTVGWSQDKIVEIVLEEGICNNYMMRDEMNIIYYRDLEASFPEWPWAWGKPKQKGLLI